MQIRVKNTNKGARGAYINGELVFVDGGATSTFTDASAADRDIAAAMDGLKVQSSNDGGKTWTDHFSEQMPEEKPWIALATDASGGNFRPLKDIDGVWYVGMAVAGERPEGFAGYSWVKVGGDEGQGVVDIPVIEADIIEPVAEPELPEGAGNEPEPEPATDYVALVNDTAPNVIDKITPENAMDIGAAEEKREGGPRKGVMKAVEEALAAEGGE